MNILANRSLTVKLFCTVGCLLQFYSITTEFLKFKVRSEVSFEDPKDFVLPAVDIMIPLINILNMTKLCHRYPDQMIAKMGLKNDNLSKTNGSSEEKCLQLDLSTPLHKYDLHSFIEVGDVFTAKIDDLQKNFLFDTFWQREKIFCDVFSYYNGLAVFYRISCKNGTDFYSSQIDMLTMRVYFELNMYFPRPFGFRLSEHDKSVDNKQTNYYMITEKFFSGSTQFSRNTVKSLKYPYETSCKDYDKMETLYKCSNDYSLGQDPPYLEVETLNFWHAHTSHLQFGGSSSSSRFKCNQKIIAPECNRVDYKLKMEIDHEHIKMKQNDEDKGHFHLANHFSFSNILFTASNEPNLVIVTHPAFPLYEYLLFSASLLGLWFGFSIVDGFVNGFYLPKMFYPIRKKVTTLLPCGESSIQIRP